MKPVQSLWIRFWDKTIWFLMFGMLPMDFIEEIKSIVFIKRYVFFVNVFEIAWIAMGVSFVLYTFIHMIQNKEVENKMIWTAGYFCGGVIFAPFLYYGIHITKVLRISQGFPYIRSIKYDEKYGVETGIGIESKHEEQETHQNAKE